MSNATTLESLSGLLDESLDSIPDAPSYVIPPKGFYKLRVTADAKDIADKPAIQLTYEILDTLELVEATDTPVANGGIFNESFFMDKPEGKSYLKRTLEGVSAHFGCTTLLQAVEKCQGLEIGGTVKHRNNKNDKDKPYCSVENITVL